MISQLEKCQGLADLHSGPEAFIIPNPWDSGSAKLLESLGFKALATTSAGFAYSIAMLNFDVIWSPETLDKHLADVKGFIPGNRMGDLYPGGFVKAADRAALIEYLQQEN
jgi:hypothetical protein